jgi:hypothetical protein
MFIIVISMQEIKYIRLRFTVTFFDQDGIRIRHGTSLCFLLTKSKYVFQSTKSNLDDFSVHYRKQLT